MLFELATTGREGLRESSEGFYVYMLSVVMPHSLLANARVDIMSRRKYECNVFTVQRFDE